MSTLKLIGPAVFVASMFWGANANAQDRINWEPGTVFAYVELDAWKKELSKWENTVTAKDGEIFTVIERNGDKETSIKVASSGVYTRPMPSGVETFDYAPVKLPFAQGAEWDWVYHYIGRNTGAVGRASRKCEAISMEEVEVPAGKFNAWRITCRGSWTSTAGSSGSTNRTMWYAPSVSAIVKSNERSSYFGGSEQFFVSLIRVSKQ